MHPPGGIIVPTHGLIRHTHFVADLFELEKPNGTMISFPVSGSIVQNLNKGLLGCMNNPKMEWAWLQSDDHAFDRRILLDMLDRELDIVVPLIVRRASPYELVFGRETTIVDELSGREYPAYESSGIDDMPSQEDPFPVEIAGNAGMLVRRHVLEAVGFPYFESSDGLKLNEDITFSKRVRELGFQVHVDPKARMGHLMALPVWPA